jgi:hypothetical protein
VRGSDCVRLLALAVAPACSFEAARFAGTNDGPSAADASPTIDAASPADGSNEPAPDASSPPDASPCPPDYLHFPQTGSCYRAVDAGTSWIAAEEACEYDGGHLVVIQSEAEITVVHIVLPSSQSWIGLTDHVDEGTFRWVTGEAADAFGPTPWQPAEPNDGGGVQDCTTLDTQGLWRDRDCRSPHAYVCEIDGVPLASPSTWCDTFAYESCGECGTACELPALACDDQVCVAV